MKRDRYKAALAEAPAAGLSPVYLDECGFRSETVREHGYAPRGEPVYDMRSSQQYRTPSLIAARTSGGFKATLMFKGTCNADRFNTWLETHLCPELTQADVVIMDNARWHKTSRTAELIDATGAKLLYLPPYSPDLNPIEHDFANIKKRWQYNHQQVSLEDIIKLYK